MKVIEYYGSMDRQGWPSGEWDKEPDKVQWTDCVTGLDCLAVRNGVGAWCGYVGVSPGHALHEVEYTEVDSEFEVHGGLTFSEHCREGDECSSICHVPAEGDDDRIWWFGFDCAHSGDMFPGDVLARLGGGPAPWFVTYRTLGYVQSQCALLAHQLANRS